MGGKPPALTPAAAEVSLRDLPLDERGVRRRLVAALGVPSRPRRGLGVLGRERGDERVFLRDAPVARPRAERLAQEGDDAALAPVRRERARGPLAALGGELGDERGVGLSHGFGAEWGGSGGGLLFFGRGRARDLGPEPRHDRAARERAVVRLDGAVGAGELQRRHRARGGGVDVDGVGADVEVGRAHGALDRLPLGLEAPRRRRVVAPVEHEAGRGAEVEEAVAPPRRRAAQRQPRRGRGRQHREQDGDRGDPHGRTPLAPARAN